jgi:superfamily I DNA/RNA helicase
MNTFEETLEKITKTHKTCLLVIAAAGSGKTTLLTEVLIRKIENNSINLSEEQVIIFTFTNNAAEELSCRIGKKYHGKQEHFNNLFIGTIHGWSNNFLKENTNLSNTKLMNELERDQFILRTYDFIEIEENYDGLHKFQKTEKFINDIELFYNENLDLDDPIIPNKTKKCISNYLEILKKQRLLDFGSLIRNAILFFKANKNYQNKNKRVHLFIDEYYDFFIYFIRNYYFH